MNDLALHYANLPIEDIERLALDVSSLTPEAKEALRLEMERRQLPTQSLDAPPQHRTPKPVSWAEDWKNTSKGVRGAMIVLSVLVVGASLAGAVLNILDHDYANAAGFPLPIALLGFRFVIFPFRIAWAARRRGGRFNRWHTGALVFGFIFAGIAYLIWKSDKPIVPEYLTA